jgi:dTDP-4-dehydrorhamnose reductase
MSNDENLIFKPSKKRHLVLGAGNLGKALEEAINNKGDSVELLSKSLNSFNYPIDSVSFILDLARPDIIWAPIGAGSVELAKKDFVPFCDLHIRLTAELLKATKKPIIFFSTDYCASETLPDQPNRSCEPKSLYAHSKAMLEKLVYESERKNVKVVRVSALYGKGKPDNCFPAKVKKRYPEPGRYTFPTNECTPTPTTWLAEFLVDNLDRVLSSHNSVVHCAPAGNTKYYQWAQKILGSQYDCQAGDLDYSRPHTSNLGCSFADVPNWEDLWQKYKEEAK